MECQLSSITPCPRNEPTTGNFYIFSGEVEYLDAAMGNRYYEATRIDELTRVRSQPLKN
jgi:hypothetical protein